MEYDPADADVTGYNQHTVYSHRVFLIEGENVITVTVTSADRSTTSTHTITVTRPSNSEPTGVPTIAGTARVGETLTASVSEIADADGLGGATFTYQWIRSDGATDTEIADATQASYRLVPTDQGKTIKVRATFIDNGGTEVALTSAATAVVQDSLLLSVPQIDGIPQVGNTLEVSFAEPPSGALAYQWLRGSEVIAGATASTHVPTVADVGARLSVRVESGGDSVTSTATAPVWPAPANPPLADGEEELLSATVTLGANRFPFWVAGYGRVLGQSFGEMDVVSFEDGGATYAIDAFLVNSRGVFALATGSTLPGASGMVAYWNGYRISGLEADTANGGKLPMLVGRTPQPSIEYSRYEDGASDGVRVAVSLRRVSAAAQNALTASFEGMPEAHDGESAFRFRLEFSEPIGISYRSLREDAFTVTGGRVTRGRRVDDRRDLFEMTVEPDGEGDVTVTLPAGRECSVSGAICTKGENRRQLTNTPTATVAGPAVETGPASLTASFVDVPAEHDGETAFTFRIAFSERVGWMNGRRLRENVVAVAGGRATSASRVDRRRDLWQVTVEPDSLADVTVTLSAGAACRTPAAVCTSDGRALSNTISTTVRGPVALSVADARAREGEDETIDFAVSLSRAASGAVSVTYATADGSATAGSDYTARQGKLRFAPGETEKTISVPVLDDAHDEGAETMQLRLSAASGAAIADGVATGTIENTDHMPAAWLARFGRTVTDQVLDAVEARLTAPRAAGAQARLAGQALPSWDGANDQAKAAANDNANASDRALAARDRDAMAAIRDWMAHAGANADRRGEGPEDRVRSRALTGRDFLTGTSFALTGGSAEAGGYAALWGRGAISRFDGREGDLTLDGEVTTGLMGADWAADRWTAGLAVGHARGTGGYREGGGCEEESCAGEVEATLTGLWPYAGLTLTDRLSAWAAAGYGAGELKLMPGGGSPFRADLTMAMGAAGMRGEVLTPPPEGGLALALKGDARFTRTASEATKDAKGGNLAAATADVWLLRTGIEGSRRFAPGGDAAGMVLTPSFEIGVRLDGGDAETGLGVDLGGGLAFAAPKQGVALDLKARGLIAHESSGFREWGASASLTWDPRPTTDRGLALTLRQGWGGSPTGGMEALLGRETLAGLAANDDGDTTASAGRLEAELGYGIAMFDGGFTGTPHLGFGLSDTGRDYRLGWRLTSARRGDPGFEIGLDATRREAANADAEHGLMLRGAIRW